MIMMRFAETKVTKEMFYTAKSYTQIWDNNLDNRFILKLNKTKTNSKYLIGYLDKALIPLFS